MHVGFSEEQELLRASARDFLSRECPIALVRAQMDSPDGLPAALWKQIAALGWIGLMVDEAHGGSGLDLVDLAVVLEESGRVLLPGPFLTTAVIGATAIACGASEARQAELLPSLVAGELRIALAWLEADARFDATGIQLTAEAHAGGYRLNGEKRFVTHAPSATRLLVPARIPGGNPRDAADGVTLLLVDVRSSGLAVQPTLYNERTRKVATVRFDDVDVPAADVLGEPGGGWPLLSKLLDRARVASCAEACGGAQKVLDLSVGYARNREQFGQPIGRFQALQHKCADMLVRVEGIRSAAYYAAWSLASEEPDGHLSACLAHAYGCDAYKKVAGDGIQIHGGLGFTWEQDLHLYFKHALATEAAWGDGTWCRELAARALIDEGGGRFSAADRGPGSR